MNVTFAAAAAVTISGDVNWASVTFSNHGTVSWTGGDIQTNMGKFDNFGTFKVTCDKTVLSPLATFEINNYSTFEKNAGNGTTTIEIQFSNIAVLPNGTVGPLPTVTIYTGTLHLPFGGGDHTVIIDIHAGTTLQLSGVSSHVFRPGSIIQGTGTVVVSGGTILTDPAAQLIASANFRLEAAGTIGGPGGFTTSGHFEWIGGEFWQLSSLRNDGLMEIKGAAEKLITQSTLENRGDVVWKDAGNIRANNSAIDNHGQFEVRNDQQILHDVFKTAAVANRGTFTKTAGGAAPTVIDGFFENYNTGRFLLNGRTFHINRGLRQWRDNPDDSPLTDLGGGTIKVDADVWVQIDSGTLSGPGTIDGSLILKAILDFGTGIGKLTVTGDYDQWLGSKIKVKIGGTGANQFDVLEVQGSATLAGAVEVQLVGEFTPNQNDTFKFLTAAGGRTGTLTPPGQWTVDPNPNDLTLEYTGMNEEVPPPPGGG